MNKTELLSTYTAEQLADMHLSLLKRFNENAESLDKVVKRLPEELREKTEILIENEKLQYEVEKYRKAFEDAKKERDCQIAEYQKKIEELTAENKKLKGNVGSENYREKQEKTDDLYGLYAYFAKSLTKDDLLVFLGVLTKELLANGIDFQYEMGKEPKVWDVKIKGDKKIVGILPTEPIKIADVLITAEGDCEPLCIGNDAFKDTYRIFGISELRQIAEHLLVYCNHNEEVKND